MANNIQTHSNTPTFLLRTYLQKQKMTYPIQMWLDAGNEKTVTKMVQIRKSEEKNTNKQRNLCVTLLQKSKGEYYQNLSVENMCNSKQLWKVVKLFLSNKFVFNEKITIVEGTEITKSDKQTAKALKNFFSNII